MKLISEEQETQYNKLRNQVRRMTRKAKKITEKKYCEKW